MNQHRNHDPIEYIKNLQLATAEELYANDIAPQGEAAVISDTVAVFDPNCKPQDEQDIKDAFCLAQLAAVKKYPGNDQATEYFYEVKTILSNIGFTNVGFEWNDVNTSSKDFTIEKELFDLLRTILSPAGFDLVQKTIAALKSSQDAGKPAWRIFSSNSHSDTNAKFSFGLVAPNGSDTMMTMTAFKLVATQVTENFLWTQWASQTLQVQSAKVQFILNSQLYADKFRAAVQQKLGIKGKAFIADLDI